MDAGGIRVVALEIHCALVGSEWESPPLAHGTVWAVFVAAGRKGSSNRVNLGRRRLTLDQPSASVICVGISSSGDSNRYGWSRCIAEESGLQ